MIFHKFHNFPNSQGFLLPARARAASTSAFVAGALGLAGAAAAAGGAGAYRGATEEVPFAPSGDGHGDFYGRFIGDLIVIFMVV